MQHEYLCMGNWEKQLIEKKEAKERDKTRREKLAGYFFNLSQLTYTALVLGGMVLFFQGNEFNFKLGVMLVLGCLLAYLLANIGNELLK